MTLGTWRSLVHGPHLAATLLVVAALVAGCSTTTAPLGGPSPTQAPPTTATPKLTPKLPDTAGRWSSCGSGFQCGTVAVPEDYTVTGSPLLSLSVVRRPASRPAQRAGVLVVDFGGPALSGAETLKVAAALLPSAILERFDVVSFDPRGTGKSGALRCASGGTAAAAAASAALVDAAVGAPPIAAAGRPLPVTVVYRRLYAACHRFDPDLLATISSSVHARDLDTIRAALGVPQLHFLGLSYGTLLGLAYAQRFPRQVAAMVLDSPIDPSQPIAELAREQAAAAEQALARAFQRRLTPAVGRQFDALARRLASARLPAPGGGDTTPVSLGDLQLATLTYLQTPTLIANYPAALAAGLAGDGGALRRLAASQYQDVDGTPLLGAYWATTCGDTRKRPSAVTANTVSRALAARYRRLGASAYAFFVGGSTAWPPAAEPVTLPTSRLPIAVVGGTGDPITPYAVAQRLVRELPGSVSITRVGEGHTAFANAAGDACFDAAESDFLLDPAAAAGPKRCTDPAPK